MKSVLRTTSKLMSGFLVLGVLSIGLTGCATKKAPGDVTAGDGSGSGAGGIGLGTLQRIYFDFNKSNISSSAADILKSNAAVMKKNKKMRVLVEGHCDERGTAEYNIALGERRARAGLDYMVSLGVPRTRLEMKSWGMEKPLDPGHNEAAWAKNRRDEFVILAK